MDAELAACLEETARVLRASIATPPSVGVVLGTGLGSFVDRMRNVVRVPFTTLPHLAQVRTRDNEGNVCLGVVDNVSVMCLQGRSHVYEGAPVWQVVHGVRLMAHLGVRAVLLTDACGSLEPSWTRGTMVVVQDHLDVMGFPLLSSPGDDGLFRPVVEMAAPYDPDLGGDLHDVARSETLLSSRIGKPVEIALRNGVYAAVRDPTCLTPAYGRMLAALGAHVVGLSLPPEVAALREMGVRVAALGYVAYVAAPLIGSAEETTGRFGLAHFERVVRGWILRAHRA